MGDSKKRTRPSTKPGKTTEPATFEDSVKRLEQIVQRIESGELSLEDSLSLFEEGVNLARASQQQLDSAERRVEQLLSIDEDGNPVAREIDRDEQE
jgi:exodeoxyribonuclease VII small subunit